MAVIITHRVQIQLVSIRTSSVMTSWCPHYIIIKYCEVNCFLPLTMLFYYFVLHLKIVFFKNTNLYHYKYYLIKVSLSCIVCFRFLLGFLVYSFQIIFLLLCYTVKFIIAIILFLLFEMYKCYILYCFYMYWINEWRY